MDDRFSDGMRDATRLTQAGRLLEATAAIQRTLQGKYDQGRQSTPNPDEVIEGEFWVSSPTGHETAPPELPMHGAEEASQRSGRASEAASQPWSARGPVSHTTQTARNTSSEVKPGGQFLSGSYANAAGARNYKLYIPSVYKGQALPLVVMLHGCTQTPEDFAAGTRMNALAEEQGFFVVYPTQARSANASLCWNWFKGSEQQREQGEPALIAGITRQIVGAYQIDPQRIYVAGLSAGGAMAVIMGMTYPDLYAAIGCHSGLAYGAAHDMRSALAAMQRGMAKPARQRAGSSAAAPGARIVPAIVFHGDRDTTVHPRNTEQLVEQWAALAVGGKDSASGPKPRVAVQQGQAVDGQAWT
ncbi:MAG TPA: PHB depolymerase family esterase, partial [Roseiflexaceae bacterium]|nr:PHB depolymerase family esterase [Roseiflexaceae bacterium]